MKKVMVGWTSGGKVHALFVESIMALQRFEKDSPSDEYEFSEFVSHEGIYVQENRNKIIQMFMKSDCDWLLQLDSDLSFRPELLRHLMMTASVTSKPIVCGLYTNVAITNRPDGSFTIINAIYGEMKNGQYTSLDVPEDLQPFQVDACGGGILLCHRHVFRHIDYPWFWVELFKNSDGSLQMMTEDLSFCRTARMSGYEIWCNPLAEATHWKELPLLPSTVRDQLERADVVFKEMSGKTRRKRK